MAQIQIPYFVKASRVLQFSHSIGVLLLTADDGETHDLKLKVIKTSEV